VNRRLLACGLAPAVFVVVLLVQGAVRPGYDPVSHFGSELANGPWGWVQEANFVVTGLLVLAFAVGLRRMLAGGRGAVAALATSHHGLWQRISIVTAFGWFGALAVKLLRDADAS
jgi:hypothetical membrane protein